MIDFFFMGDQLLLDIVGGSAFAPVKMDINGNITVSLRI